MNRRQFGILAGSALVAGPAFAAGSVDLDRLKLEIRLVGEVLELFGFYDGDEGVAVRFRAVGGEVGGQAVSAVFGPNSGRRVSRRGPRPFARDLASRSWRAIAPVEVRKSDGTDLSISGATGLLVHVRVYSADDQRTLEARLVDTARQG